MLRFVFAEWCRDMRVGMAVGRAQRADPVGEFGTSFRLDALSSRHIPGLRSRVMSRLWDETSRDGGNIDGEFDRWRQGREQRRQR